MTDFQIIRCKNTDCKQKLRIPTDKGKLRITCPKCKGFFSFDPDKQVNGRLSKLQKWTLMNCYHVVDGKEYVAMRRKDIIQFFAPDLLENPLIPTYYKGCFSSKRYNKINATISRSIRGLRNKGYVTLIGHTGKQDTFDLEAIQKDIGGCERPEEYLEKHKNQDITDMFKDYRKWIKKSEDLVVEIDNGSFYKTKMITLTEKGIEKAKELLKLNSSKS